ncbi:hypothetical protein BGW37DRAFT_464780 [Umbelopsis sp. PMI_123]|nr:hypothetical protein BGW37DRAFT_464780 [Umbelopsis sp. PMI_123]
MFASQATSTILISKGSATAFRSIMTAESQLLTQYNSPVATGIVVPSTNTTGHEFEQHGPLYNNSVYVWSLPIFCIAVACIYISVWVWSCHRTWHIEHREAKRRLDHWRNHMLLARVSKRLSKHLHEIKRSSQPALAKWHAERSDSKYGVRRHTYMEKDGKADYSQYAGDTISVDLTFEQTPNPIPFSTLRYHKSLNARIHHSIRRTHRRLWRSHDIRNFSPVTFHSLSKHSWKPSSSSSISVAGTTCSCTSTIFERAGSDTDNSQYPDEKV